MLGGACYEWGMQQRTRPSPLQSTAGRLVRAGGSLPWVRRIAAHPRIVRGGYLFASAAGLAWGDLLSVGRLDEVNGVIVARGCPHWSFGRGGTTIGRVYLTSDNDFPDVLDHEAVHRAQWERYGLAFILLYLAAGPIARENRFEVEAGLEKGGYR